MSNNIDMLDKRHVFTDCEDKYVCKVRRSEHSFHQVCEHDKKMKREIANSNERRRMQSINTGFETLKELLPMSVDGEKLSKASILQLTAKYIQTLLSRLSTLEKEIAGYKKATSTSTKDKTTTKSPMSHSQEQTRKRRLNIGTSDSINATETTLDAGEVYLECDPPLHSSELCLLSSENSDKTPGSLEHLVAAIEQVEGERFYVSGNHDKSLPIGSVSPLQHSNLLNHKVSTSNTNDNATVMKPTISPYTEKIIRAVSKNPHMFDPPLGPHNLFGTDNRSVTFPYRGNTTSADDENYGECGLQMQLIKYRDVAIHKNRTL